MHSEKEIQISGSIPLQFPRLIQSVNPDEAAAEMAKLRKPNKSWIEQEPFQCTLEELQLTKGQMRYTVTHKDVPFECLFLPAKSKKLFVMLSGGRTPANKRYPLLLRWKYQNFLQGNVLCIDDPMYHFHGEFISVQWYYGTAEQSYLHLLTDIVKKVMAQQEIRAEDVVFVGSSGGGYSALYSANLLDHSSAIAINPQVILKDWQVPTVYDHFASLGIDLAQEDKFGRNELKLTNTTCHFFISFNYSSQNEWKLQFTPFLAMHDITPTFGISQHGNIITWINATDYNNPHSAIPTKTGIALAAYFLEAAKNGMDINTFNDFSLLLNEELHEKYEIMDKRDVIAENAKCIGKYFISMTNRLVKSILQYKLQMKAPASLQRFTENNFTLDASEHNAFNIGYYIGEQRILRYNMFCYKNKYFFRLKFDDFRQYVPEYKKVEAYLNSIRGTEISAWHYEADSTMIITVQLSPDTMEQQISAFIDVTFALLDNFLK
ncbi:MAG: hypothetical protein E7502_01440 [Ruminococcus sp.]|nr:hypothetical protein [Ruminococcus sp.]